MFGDQRFAYERLIIGLIGVQPIRLCQYNCFK